MSSIRVAARRFRTAALAAALAFSGGSLVQAAAGDPALLAKQEALFEQMRLEPTNLPLMFDYAMVSIELDDYEPAISTLERMLIFNDDLPRVKLELGAAYYRLGAYDAAAVYFDQVLASNPPPNVRARIGRFRDVITGRQEESADPFSGYASAGIVYTTNANLGPDDREIDAAILGGIGFLDPDATSAEDFGMRASAYVQHIYDLDRGNRDIWLSTLSGTTLHFFEESDGDLDAARISTGPSLTIGEGDDAPRARPYVDAAYVRSGNESLYAAYGGGVDYSNPIGRRTALFASATGQYRDYLEDRDDFDGTNLGVSVGAAYGAAEDTIVRGALFGDVDLTGTEYTENYEAGLRASVEHRYRPGVSIVPEKPWVLNAFAQGSRRWFDGPDNDIDPNTTRKDWDVTLGLINAVPVAESVSLVGTARYFERSSNIRNFDLDSFEVGLDVRVTF